MNPIKSFSVGAWMKRLGALALLFVFSVSIAQAQVITFDNLTGSQIPIGYAGLDWSNFFVLNAATYPTPSGYQNGMISAPNVAYNAYGNPASFSSATPFTFNGGYFTAAWNNGLSINVIGYNGSTQVDNATFIVNATGPTLETLNWTNLTEVYFNAFGGTSAGYGEGISGTNFALDNLMVSAVPEPSELGMFAIGLGLIGLAARRRQKSRLKA